MTHENGIPETDLELLTKKELSEMLKCSTYFIEQNLLKDPEFPARYISPRVLRFRWSEVLDYISAKPSVLG